MRTFLAIDYGKKKIGLAYYRAKQMPTPMPLGKIVVKNLPQVMKELKHIIHLEEVDTIVLGLPKYLTGDKSKITVEVEKFKCELEKHFPALTIHYVDEAYSSQEAKQRMQESPRYNFKIDSNKIDEVAAQIILETYLENN